MNNADSRASSPANNSLRTTLAPIVVLVTICAVAGILLGFVYSATAPIAAQAAYERQQETYQQLLPEATAFEDLPVTDTNNPRAQVTAAVRATDAQQNAVGTIVVGQAKGYSGAVPVAVAFDTQGAVVSMQAMKNDETPGLGTRIAEESFINQFVGLAAQPIEQDAIDTISGATISSNAAIEAFNVAAQAYKEVA